MTIKTCDKHGECERRRFYRRLCAFLLILVIIVLFIILIVWLSLRPTKPRFYIQDASVRELNVSASSDMLSSILQVTIATRNPNDRIGIYYDRIDVYATYKYQQITLPAQLPPVYQGHNDIDVWSPYLYGADVPIAPFLGNSILQDCQAGFILIHVKVDGRIRWKVGSWISGHYHLFVTCPAFLVTQGNTQSFRFQQMASCSVEV
ncbi:hypothetical protein LUZ61_007314 [Rhynchospora tenuis]|uniref:Late embryogenesis abundant protein LEA-2 subgroup domain-containing protein n=1 Tax=Rhynchospora tenuis TaxID=198213 RepID=A0AAD5ZT58_9POAL|nr:hypothetical protein LUZ61_007314 [Rhynchospora tenuis]